jgi:transcriptional regulator with XRE-family HTH domain
MIGAEIRRKREGKAWARHHLVSALKRAGVTVHPNTIANWEGGKGEPTYTQLMALHEVLGISLTKEEDDVARNGDAPHE